MKQKIVLLLLLIPLQLIAKVLIITHSYNRPDFINVQLKSFQALLKDEFEYIVFNDASNDSLKRQIEQTCNNLGIRCVRIPQQIHSGHQSPGHRHMDGIKYALEQEGFNHEGIVTLIDSDMFLIKPFSIEKYLENYDIAGELQGRKNNHIEVRYLSPAVVFINMQTLPNKHSLSFEGNHVEGLACDVGGHTYYYFRDNPQARRRTFGVLHIGAWKVTGIQCKQCDTMTCSSCVKALVDNNFSEPAINFIQNCPDDIEFYLDHSFLHYRGGTNWNNRPAQYHNRKTKALESLMVNLGINLNS